MSIVASVPVKNLYLSSCAVSGENATQSATVTS